MRRRWWVIIASLSGLVLVLSVVWPRGGPTYQGRSLRVWLKDFDGESPESRWRAADAVQHMGTNAVPFLVSQLAHGRRGPEPRWKQRIRALLGRQALIKIRPYQPSDERGEALAALDALGPNAKTALPALEGLLREKPPDPRALLVLARLGSEAVPALTGALTNDERAIRFGARSCLEMMQSHSDILFPKNPEEGEFMRRMCQFNQTLILAAFREYQSQHPEQFQPGNADKMSLLQWPLGLAPPKVTSTNSPPSTLRTAASGFE